MDAKQAEEDGMCWDCELVGALAMAKRDNDALRAQVVWLTETLESLTAFCDQKHIADKLWEANSISGGTIGELTTLLSSAHEAFCRQGK